jgi:DNA-binding XRE family transcriptional regulator
MDAVKRNRLEAAGWRFGDAQDFLDLTPEEVEIIEVKLALSDYARRLRLNQHLTQTQVAERIGSSQSRVAKMESADATVSLDLLMRCIFALGATTRDVGRVISGAA